MGWQHNCRYNGEIRNLRPNEHFNPYHGAFLDHDIKGFAVKRQVQHVRLQHLDSCKPTKKKFLIRQSTSTFFRTPQEQPTQTQHLQVPCHASGSSSSQPRPGRCQCRLCRPPHLCAAPRRASSSRNQFPIPTNNEKV